LLEAVLCEVGSRGLRLVASDNHRLAVAEVPLLNPRGIDHPSRLLLSVKALALLGRLIGDQEEPVRAHFGPPEAFFRVGRATLSARLLQGRFPNWQAALPADGRRVADLAVGALLEGVRQAAVLREPTGARLLLRLGPGRLVLESQQVGAGRIRVEQAADYPGQTLALAFNPVYLLELLRALEGEPSVRLELGAPGRAALLVAPDGYRHALMPLGPANPASEPVFASGHDGTADQSGGDRRRPEVGGRLEDDGREDGAGVAPTAGAR
jgi:DNA polymerase-3 subunit beta